MDAPDPSANFDPNNEFGSLAHEEAEHRLANLFQIVISNLDQAARSVDGPARLALGAAAMQVRILGRLQREPLQLQDRNDPFGTQVEGLAAFLKGMVLGPSGHTLTVTVDPELLPVRLPAQTARCLDLIVIEAVINVVKHAFPAGQGGRISLQLHRDATQLACSIVDNGKGALSGPGRVGSQGMRLIDALARHAGGQCRWVFSQSGTDVRVLLPLPGADKASTSHRSVRSGNQQVGPGICG